MSGKLGKDVFNIVCPCCGYKFSKPKDISSKIMRLVSNYTKETSTALKKTMRNIYNNVPSDANPTEYYYFLYGIQQFDEVHIRYGIRVFDKGGHHLGGKGFKFLRSIIKNRQANFDKQLKNERKSYGKLPDKSVLK
tara:strand:- start:12459 stop:12866 length:408 start_codon:yes stop_codon:yes gene_type:complete